LNRKKKDDEVETPAVIHMEAPAAVPADDRDADLDILLPSDIRSSAGRPKKTRGKTETPDEKRERRAMMEENFEILDGEDRFYEGAASEENVQRHRERVQEEALWSEGSGLAPTHQVPSSAVQGKIPPATSGEKFFILIRSKPGTFTLAPLPPLSLATPTLPAVRVLENLDAPDAFLQHWSLLHAQGFQVVAGEGECVIVKAPIEAAKERSERVIAELERRGATSPAIELPTPMPTTPGARKTMDAVAPTPAPAPAPALPAEARQGRAIGEFEQSTAFSPAIRLPGPAPTPTPVVHKPMDANAHTPSPAEDAKASREPVIAGLEWSAPEPAIRLPEPTPTPTPVVHKTVDPAAPAPAPAEAAPLSPAEEAARENWEKKRQGVILEAPTPEPPRTRQDLEALRLAEKLERQAHAEREKEKKKSLAKPADGKQKRKKGKIFWTSVWVAAVTGATTIALENYI
jgi:hypothetical protein